MNKYETVFIINPNVEDDGVKALIEKFTGLIAKNGTVESVDEWGKRRFAYEIDDKTELGMKKLAYDIKKNKEGNYVVINFEANPELIKELERVYRITDEVIKFIVVRKDEE